jgi:CubicO group peptidase (beta-lactamase class C family)
MTQDFPAKVEDQVTLANWRIAPHNEWAFHHVREIVPSANIANDSNRVRELDLKLMDWSDLRWQNADSKTGLDAFLEETATDGFVVLHHGKIVAEQYDHGMTARTPHILMSVSKSMLGLLAGILIDQGVLKEKSLITDHLPELSATAYAGATIRHLLDMRVGVEFNEDYLITSGPIIDYRKATNWNPLEAGDMPADLRSFFASLTTPDGPHEGRFHYVSPNTDLLAWIIERSAGRRYADLMSELLWKPLGASADGYITVDRLGAPRAAGGMCVTTRDLALVGQLVVDKGRRGDRQIVPQAWIDDMLSGGDASAWNVGDFAEDFPNLPMRYRSKWYVIDGDRPLLFCLGIHGQYLFVDRSAEVVIAKQSSRATPLDEADERQVIQAAMAVRNYLS